MKVLLTEQEIREGVGRLADEISRFYAERPLTIIGVLTGGLVLLADVIRRINLPHQIGVVRARSYRGAATTPGPLAIALEMLPEVRGRDVLLLDDIFDTGQTLEKLAAEISRLRPASVRSAVLLLKDGRQEVAMRPDHVVFQIPNHFVVGYGLDYQDGYRHLPYIATLDDADLEPIGRSGAAESAAATWHREIQ